MATKPFLNKAISRIERIDKDSLKDLVFQLTQEKKDLEDLIDQLPIGAITLDQHLEIHLSNRIAKSLTGIFESEKKPFTLTDTQLDRHFITKVRTAIQQGNELYDEPYEIYEPRHSTGILNLRVLGSGSAPKLFGLLFQPDSKNDERLRERHHAEKLLSILTLASGIAHELGNPLNSIGVHLHLLASDISKLPEPERSKLRRSVSIVAEEASRLDHIVRNFLKSTRQKPLFFQIASIHDVIEKTLILLEPELSNSNISVKTSFDTAIPEFYLDSERMSQVFINLIKNSIQAMPQGGTLRIKTDRKKNTCEILISDTGIGIKPNDLPKIFDAYYTTKDEGSGLGLVISYQIIREHSGRIEVTSKPGKGTSILIILPIRKEKLQLPAPKEKVKSHGPFI